MNKVKKKKHINKGQQSQQGQQSKIKNNILKINNSKMFTIIHLQFLECGYPAALIITID